MRMPKCFTLDVEINEYVDTTKGNRSASERVNELLRRAMLEEQYEKLEAEAASPAAPAVPAATPAYRPIPPAPPAASRRERPAPTAGSTVHLRIGRIEVRAPSQKLQRRPLERRAATSSQPGWDLGDQALTRLYLDRELV